MSKRSEFQTFINTGTTGSPVWELLGEGITSGTLQYNPQTTEEVYIHQDSGTTEIESYRPTQPFEAKHKETDAALAYLDGLRKTRPVLADALGEIVNVWLYETPTAGAYPAERQTVGIQFDTFGGDGGTENVFGFTLNYRGDPVPGTFNPTTTTFTAT